MSGPGYLSWCLTCNESRAVVLKTAAGRESWAFCTMRCWKTHDETMRIERKKGLAANADRCTCAEPPTYGCSSSHGDPKEQ